MNVLKKTSSEELKKLSNASIVKNWKTIALCALRQRERFVESSANRVILNHKCHRFVLRNFGVVQEQKNVCCCWTHQFAVEDRDKTPYFSSPHGRVSKEMKYFEF